MISKKGRYILIFVITGLLIGLWGFVEIMDLPVGEEGDEYLIIFDQVTGLTPSDPITVQGIDIGRVRSIGFYKDSVSVRAWISKKVTLHRNASARIKPLGMIGEKYIDLDPGSADALLPKGGIVRGRYLPDLADSGENLDELLQSTATLLKTLNNSINPGELKKIQRHTARAAADLEKITRQSKKTLSRMDTLLSTGVKWTKRHEAAIDSSMTALETGTARIPLISARLDSVLSHLSVITHDLKTGQGTAGRLLIEDSLYVQASITLNHLDSLLTDVQKNPGRYLKAGLINF